MQKRGGGTGLVYDRGMGWERIAVGLTLVIFVVIYARTSDYAYVWDDVDAIAENPIFAGPVLEGLFATQHDHLDPAFRKLSGIKPAHDSYRPLLYLSYRADLALFGMSPRAMHLHNLVLGFACILAFYLVASGWLLSRAAVVPATILFALHPLQVEAVAYVSARGDLLAALCALVALALAFRAANGASPGMTRTLRGFTIAGSTLCFVASLLCKEAYLGLPIALAGIALAQGTLRRHRAVIASWLAALGLYLLLRFSVGGVTGSGTGASAVLALPGVLLQYLRIALLPVDLSTERLHDPSYVLPGWVALVLFVSWVALRRNRLGESARIVASGLWWMLVLLAPSVIVVSLLGVLADRYAYLPLAGFAVASSTIIASTLENRPGLRIPVAAAAAFWAAMCLAVTVTQVGVWQSNRTLYTHAVLTEPESAMAHYRLGHSYARESRWELAVPLFERAAELDPSNIRVLNNLGVAYLNMQEYRLAADTFERALAESGQMHFRAWYNLGVAKMNLGEGTAACADVARALEINPNYEAAATFRRASCGE